MPYYPTIEEDLKRAKAILAKGQEGVTCPEYRPDHNGECLNCDEWADAHGGGIDGADLYAAYKLLESFVEAIEAIGPKICEIAVRQERAEAAKHGLGLRGI